MKHFYIFWLNVFVFAGQSVVDKTTVEEGETFTITCDHLHVNGTIPNCSSIFFEVSKRSAPDGISILISLPSEETDGVNIPNHWTKDCKSPILGEDATQVSCKLIVKEAKVSDSGRYGCVIGVRCGEDPISNFEGHSDVVVAKATTTTLLASTSSSSSIAPPTMLLATTSSSSFADTRKTETESKAAVPNDTRKTETEAVPNVSETTTKSEASSSFSEKTITGLCLMMTAATQL